MIGAGYGATDCGNPSSDVGLGRDSGTSGDGERTRSEEAVRVGSLRIHGNEDDEDVLEDDGGDDDDDDDDDDSDGDGNDDEPVPVAHCSSSGHRPVPSKEKGGSFMSVMSPADGCPQDSVLVLLYSGRIASSIRRGQVI
ncbi:hypothetical protein M9H77_09727 [Catharanthus roseus]|uniref:Uncharacterized protein n=1 Tax=Catharanthus roseus TaxID=4058 RepID=A0ACC0C1S0_CATRO|nr:hypothetical protein M9H77_09727 [Catharanthus roseus]